MKRSQLRLLLYLLLPTTIAAGFLAVAMAFYKLDGIFLAPLIVTVAWLISWPAALCYAWAMWMLHDSVQDKTRLYLGAALGLAAGIGDGFWLTEPLTLPLLALLGMIGGALTPAIATRLTGPEPPANRRSAGRGGEP
jgi:Na+/melibiose symporter-like transporter